MNASSSVRPHTAVRSAFSSRGSSSPSPASSSSCTDSQLRVPFLIGQSTHTLQRRRRRDVQGDACVVHVTDVIEARRRHAGSGVRVGAGLRRDRSHQHAFELAATTRAGRPLDFIFGVVGSTASKGTSTMTTLATSRWPGSKRSSSAGVKSIGRRPSRSPTVSIRRSREVSLTSELVWPGRDAMNAARADHVCASLFVAGGGAVP